MHGRTPEMIEAMRKQLTDANVKELNTPTEVEEFFGKDSGMTLLVVNSVCGCAAGAARPGIVKALQHEKAPEKSVSVFAGVDADATAKVREIFNEYPPSSPCAILVKDGKGVFFLPREEIMGKMPSEVAQALIQAFEEHSQ